MGGSFDNTDRCCRRLVVIGSEAGGVSSGCLALTIEHHVGNGIETEMAPIFVVGENIVDMSADSGYLPRIAPFKRGYVEDAARAVVTPYSGSLVNKECAGEAGTGHVRAQHLDLRSVREESDQIVRGRFVIRERCRDVELQ